MTSEEYLSEIEKKNKKNEKRSVKKTKKPKKTRKPSESDSDNEIVKLDDESDIENVTLHDIFSNEENSFDFENNEADEASPLKEGDYVLMRFATKCKNVFYVAQIDELGDEDVDVIYPRRNMFLEPVIAEKYSVLKTDIECQLPAPTVQGVTKRTAKQFIFPTIDFVQYNVQ